MEVEKSEKNGSMKGRAGNMDAFEEVWVVYDGFFYDKLTAELIYESRDNIKGFRDEKDNLLSKSEVAGWIMKHYYNRRKFVEYRWKEKGRTPDTAEQLYQWNEDYRKSVDEERLYLLYMIGIPVTKVANIFGVSRQTVYSRVKKFEEHEFLHNGRVS